MSFTRARPQGWIDDSTTIDAVEINQIDVNQSRAVDGNAGGTWTPSSAVNINAPGGLSSDQINSSTLKGNLTVSGDLASVRWRNTLVDNATPPDLDGTADTWFLKGTLASNHDVTVFHSGGTGPLIVDGTRMYVRLSYSGAFSVTFRREDTNGILVYTSGAGVTAGAFTLEFDGTHWQPISWSGPITAIVDL